MARPYRLQAEDTLYHIISRGNDRKKIFLKERDYLKFLKNLEIARDRYAFHLYAYVLMTNHVHLLLETTAPNISQIMQNINSSYTTYFNIKHKKSGHLFQGRYKSIVVDKDAYLLELTRYIHLNPVRAKMVRSPSDYPWSSWSEYTAKRPKKPLISWGKLTRYIKYSPVGYKRFVLDSDYDHYTFSQKPYAGFILGQARFIKDTLNILKDQVQSNETSFAKELSSHYTMHDVIELYGQNHNIDPQNLFHAKGKRSFDKKLVIYLIKRLTSHTNADIGKEFNLSFSAVSKASKSIESLVAQNKKMRTRISRIVSSFKV